MKSALICLSLILSVASSYAQTHVKNEITTKSVLIDKIRLDSTVESLFNNTSNEMELQSKQEFFYDESGNDTSRILFHYDNEIQQWRKSRKWEYSYDSNNKLVVEILNEWDNQNNLWTSKYKHEYEYDSEFNRIVDVSYLWYTTEGNWMEMEKYEYEYDLYGNLLLDSKYNWNRSNSEWEGVNKTTFSFDLLGNETLKTTFLWGGVNFESGVWEYGWIKDRKYEKIFNSSNLLATSIEQIWYGEWTNQNKNEYDYNSHGDIELNARFSWNSNLTKWQATEKYELVLDTINLEGLATQSQWLTNDSAWQINEKNEIKLDENGNNTEQLTWKIDHSLDSLILFEKTSSSYDSHGNKTVFIQSKWNTSTNDWIWFFKEEKSFDTKNRVILLTRWIWKEELEQWAGTQKYETIYDDYGNITENLKYSWDAEAGAWTGDLRTGYNYNTSVLVSDIIVPNYLVQEHDKHPYKIDSVITYSFDNLLKSWKVKSEVEYYYSGVNFTGYQETSLNEILIFPNPTSNFIHIANLKNPMQFELFSANGTRMISVEVSEWETIPVNQLMPGIYFYRLTDYRHLRSGKIVVQ
ncbi:T9SS type A sorting domain-containing protein [Prolixibacteraceae bacterium Z1-6]|uniref:T9SS type A sorting domain-containing protein n=1 Tax=Draconibacterium aestuarii TaxID=2998507 RepID=A0A9X3FCY7_9BACT|nr:T9SS type A sorting domain-containing protein [Prolixibacteraceae bacterium Z1-6]